MKHSASKAADPSQNAAETEAESHKNEGFLKSAWHKLTHQHDNLAPDEAAEEPKGGEKPSEAEPKKATGSG